ncbi:hypothetical protein [Kroppenstedtia guangzhouensis]|uniref:hypothetical protein n=1 Tax=Kroppenstedtia guangzhouensis TaxID=1274356 RepID=UPI00166CF589|nr:hypothetical protein [Kroppenstedtia guangzhouensis]
MSSAICPLFVEMCPAGVANSVSGPGFGGGTGLLPWISDRFGGRRLSFLFFGVGACLGGTLLLLSLWVTGSGWGMVFLCVWIGFFGIGWYSLFLVQVAESTV